MTEPEASAERYWEGRWRTERNENMRLCAEIERLRAALDDLRQRSIDEGIHHFVKLIDATLSSGQQRKEPGAA